jgi:sterol desaturase/sphingolipid hydroxylase (fatty acid hydroxylase superfamily)
LEVTLHVILIVTIDQLQLYIPWKYGLFRVVVIMMMMVVVVVVVVVMVMVVVVVIMMIMMIKQAKVSLTGFVQDYDAGNTKYSLQK